MHTLRTLRSLFSLPLVAALAACGTPAGEGPTDPAGSGQVRLRVEGALLAARGVTRATLTVGPGKGLPFAPLEAPLSQRPEGGWSVFLGGVPVGRQREVAVTASDAAGAPLFQGSSFADIAPGATSEVVVLLQQVAPPPGLVVSSPSVSVSVSTAVVRPGGTALLAALVGDGTGRPLRYAWAASCGSFSAADQASTTWTAPSQPNRRCELSFTAANPFASTSVGVPVDVQLDLDTRSVSGRRFQTCWGDPRPGTLAATKTTGPAPDVEALPAPDALVRSPQSGWATHPGGHVGPDGSFYQGAFGSDGTFYIPGLPPDRAYLLSFRLPDGTRLLVETASLDVDLGYDQLGRCRRLAWPGTAAAFQLSALEPWDATSGVLQAASSAADAWRVLATGADVAQDATAASLQVGWTGALLVPSDVLWLAQLSPHYHPAGFAYLAASRAARVSDVLLAGGGLTTVATALTPVAQSGSTPVRWSPLQFERWQQDLGPPGRLTSSQTPAHRLTVSASPFAGRYPSPDPAGALELARLEAWPGTLSVDLVTPLQYGQFLPAFWQERRDTRYTLSVAYQAPGAGDWLYFDTSIARSEPIPAPAVDLAPLLTPARAPRINGVDALADLPAPVSDQPAFTWSAPAVGAPSLYALEVFALRAVAGRSTAQRVLRYLTSSPAAALPPGSLAPGELYFARIVAQASDVPFRIAPLRHAPLHAEASVLTGTFTP